MGTNCTDQHDEIKSPLSVRVGILKAPHIDYELREHTFLLKNVRIGIGFHWDRREDQEFMGKLEIKNIPNPILKGGKEWQMAVNTIDLEDYLCSVISSEMNADSPMELLKAHAVISRSWAIRQIVNSKSSNRKLHEGFDLCADDHCQRYEGIRRMNDRAVEAVRATAGQVLTFPSLVHRTSSLPTSVCDCRYHKCCGGRTEVWRTCWEDMDVPYIQSVECPYCDPAYIEKSLVHHTSVLRTFLNDYDRETRDFHDWQVTYSAEELGDIIRTKSGIDFGEIVDLIPLKRGASGRIYELKIVGTKHTEIIGKELKIRQWLSRTCLYSSWFDIEKNTPAPSGEGREGASSWVLTGHGWGHGAGLCQIGAAVMAAQGKSYQKILSHYYVGTELTTIR